MMPALAEQHIGLPKLIDDLLDRVSLLSYRSSLLSLFMNIKYGPKYGVRLDRGALGRPYGRFGIAPPRLCARSGWPQAPGVLHHEIMLAWRYLAYEAIGNAPRHPTTPLQE
jgi:hypothetical protein